MPLPQTNPLNQSLILDLNSGLLNSTITGARSNMLSFFARVVQVSDAVTPVTAARARCILAAGIHAAAPHQAEGGVGACHWSRHSPGGGVHGICLLTDHFHLQVGVDFLDLGRELPYNVSTSWTPRIYSMDSIPRS